MLQNLGLGTLIISLTVVIHILGLTAVTQVMQRIGTWLLMRRHRRTLAMVAVVGGLFAVTTCEIWLWAGCHYMLGVVPDFDTALYFSTVTFSTVGYGDVVPPQAWRLLVALEGINGFLLIGWSTAYLVAAGTRIGPFRLGEHF